MHSANPIPQSMFSSRMQTNNIFSAEEGIKEEIVREKIKFDNNYQYNSIKKHQQFPVKNTGDISNKPQINHNNREEKIEILDISNCERNKSVSQSFDEKIMIKTKGNSFFLTCNRMLYSKNCIHFYIFLMVFSVAVFVYSLIALLLKLSKFYINFR
jgi:hypothetical protein